MRASSRLKTKAVAVPGSLHVVDISYNPKTTTGATVHILGKSKGHGSHIRNSVEAMPGSRDDLKSDVHPEYDPPIQHLLAAAQIIFEASISLSTSTTPTYTYIYVDSYICIDGYLGLCIP